MNKYLFIGKRYDSYDDNKTITTCEAESWENAIMKIYDFFVGTLSKEIFEQAIFGMTCANAVTLLEKLCEEEVLYFGIMHPPFINKAQTLE